MPKKITLFLFLFTQLSYSQKMDWQQLSDFPGLGFDDGLAFVSGNTVFVTGGLNTGYYIAPDVWEFHSDSNQWFNQGLVNFPPRQYASGFYTESSFCLIGGKANTVFSDCYCIENGASQWNSFPFPNAPARKQQVSGNLGNRLFFGLGSDGTSCYSDWWEYNLTAKAWEKRPDFPGNARKEAVLVPWGNQLFVGLGIDSTETIGFHDWYAYEPSGQTWTRLADFPGQNIQYSAALGFMDGLICLTGMNENKEFYNESYFYQPSRNEWLAMGQLPFSPRKGVSATSQGNTLYIIAGIDSSYQRSTEVWQGKYSPTANSLTFFPNPTKNELFIQSSFPVTAKLRVLNIQGQALLETSFHNQVWPKLNLQALPAGLYFLEYETDFFKTVEKIQKGS